MLLTDSGGFRGVLVTLKAGELYALRNMMTFAMTLIIVVNITAIFTVVQARSHRGGVAASKLVFPQACHIRTHYPYNIM